MILNENVAASYNGVKRIIKISSILIFDHFHLIIHSSGFMCRKAREIGHTLAYDYMLEPQR